MTKIFATLGLMMLSDAATAQHMFLTSVDTDRGTIMAVDTDTIRDVGSYRRAWVLMGVANSATQMRSFYANTLFEYDCVGERSQRLAGKIYKTSGELMADLPAESFTYLAPGSNYYTAMRAVCRPEVIKEDEVTAQTIQDLFARFLALMADKKK